MAGLLLTACGGGGSSSSARSGSTPSASSASTPTAASSAPRTPEQLATDQKTAETIVFKLSDFDPGWETDPLDTTAADSPEGKAATTQLGECLQVDPSLVLTQSDNTKTTADSDTFTDGQTLQASSTATLAPSAEEASTVFSALQRPEAGSCLKDFYTASWSYLLAHPQPGQEPPSDLTIGTLYVELVDPPLPDIHGKSVTYRVRIPSNEAGTVNATNTFIDVVFAAQGRTTMTLRFQNIGGSFRQPRRFSFPTP